MTFRWTDGTETRTSCWTNILPEGFFGEDFYGPESEWHCRALVNRLLGKRKKEPALEELWGHWNKAAPSEYGIVVIDYRDRQIMSCNHYTTPTTACVLAGEGGYDKFDALNKAGIVSNVQIVTRGGGLKPAKTGQHPTRGTRFFTYEISLPGWEYQEFQHDQDGLRCAYDWVISRFSLSEEEKAEWESSIESCE